MREGEEDGVRGMTGGMWEVISKTLSDLQKLLYPCENQQE